MHCVTQRRYAYNATNPAKIWYTDKEGEVISKVKIMIETTVVTSVITGEAVDKLGIKEGDEVFAIVKSTEVMIGKKSRGSS